MYRKLLVCFICFSSCLSAQITWQATESSQEADLFAEGLLYTFHGVNSGSEPVKIKSLASSCPCLHASSDKSELATGEEFLVVAEFDPYEMGGTQRQRVFVAIEGKEEPDVLTVTAELPETITLSKKRLFWKANSEANGQTLSLSLSESQGVELIDVYAMDENFSTQLKEVSANSYTLTVMPEDLSVLRPAAVMIRYTVNGRSIRTTVPCFIGEKNPFEFSYKPKLKRLTGSQIESSIRNQEPLHIPEGLSNIRITPPESSETESEL